MMPKYAPPELKLPDRSEVLIWLVTVMVPVFLIQTVLHATAGPNAVASVSSAPPMFIVAPVKVPGDRSSTMVVMLVKVTT